MCGRYTLSTPAEVVAELVGLDAVPELPLRYNIAPTQEVAAVRVENDARAFAWLRWGLVPFWADDPSIGNRMINARAETVAEKPAFRDSFKKRRCLVLADGFYEWQKVKGDSGKQPWHFEMADGSPFAFAGLWSSWRPKDEEDAEPLETCNLLTTDANAVVKPVHHRMPVILRPEDYELWLDPEVSDRDTLESVLGPYDPEAMTAWPVSREVNKPQNDHAGVIERVEWGDGAGDGGGGGQKELF
jgi:putative SOS response-associated peptidase YedK